MGEDSFRGSCLKCGGPIREGNIHRECAQLELQSTQSFADANKMVGKIFSRVNYKTGTIARIPDMANVQVCERCGSIGQARDFISLSAFNMTGNSLVLPQLITERQYERGIEESDKEEEEPQPQSNFTLCRNCKASLRMFLSNQPTDSGSAGPLAPRLPTGGNGEPALHSES